MRAAGDSKGRRAHVECLLELKGKAESVEVVSLRAGHG